MVHLGLADDDPGLIDRAVQVLQNFELQETLRRRGRELLIEHCGEDRTVEQVLSMYEKIRANQNN